MTTLEQALAASGASDPARLRDAAAVVAPWLGAAPPDEVATGLAAAGDPAAALHRLARLLETEDAAPVPGRVAPLLRILGGSAALAGALVAEGTAWPALLETVLMVGTRTAADHRSALDRGAVDRAELQTMLRRHRHRELVRIGGRDLVGLASVEETVRELSALS
jgi:glutamine synthetase adenylyltransferase